MLNLFGFGPGCVELASFAQAATSGITLMPVLHAGRGFGIPEAVCFSPVCLAWPWALMRFHGHGMFSKRELDFLKGHALFRVVLASVDWRTGPRQPECQAGAGVRGRPESEHA